MLMKTPRGFLVKFNGNPGRFNLKGLKSPSQYGEYNFLKIQNKFKKFFLLWQDIAQRKKFKLKFSYKKNLITNLVCISTIFTNKDLTRDRVHLSNQSQLTSMNDWQTKNRQTYFQKKKN